jgi:purine-nucleoside phosphorylase
MVEDYSVENESLFTPRHFIRHYAPHLQSVRLPEGCLLSLIPGTEKMNPYSPGSHGSFLMHSHYWQFSVPVEYVLIYGGIGAPSAVISLEIARELGVGEIIAVGTCGLLDESIETGSILLPGSFICEEGTSLHYQTSAEPVVQDTRLVEQIQLLMHAHEMPFYQGVHWTTDAPFRETGLKVRQHQGAQCLSVDMEASALLSAARFYCLPAAVVLIGSDYLSRSSWSPPRPSFNRVRDTIRKLFDILPGVFRKTG